MLFQGSGVSPGPFSYYAFDSIRQMLHSSNAKEHAKADGLIWAKGVYALCVIPPKGLRRTMFQNTTKGGAFICLANQKSKRQNLAVATPVASSYSS